MDDAGNVYGTGVFTGSVGFGPGLTLTGGDTSWGDASVKLDASGNTLWARGQGGSGPEIGEGIAVDVSGNVYTTGLFQNTADLTPAPASST